MNRRTTRHTAANDVISGDDNIAIADVAFNLMLIVLVAALSMTTMATFDPLKDLDIVPAQTTQTATAGDDARRMIVVSIGPAGTVMLDGEEITDLRPALSRRLPESTNRKPCRFRIVPDTHADWGRLVEVRDIVAGFVREDDTLTFIAEGPGQ